MTNASRELIARFDELAAPDQPSDSLLRAIIDAPDSALGTLCVLADRLTGLRFGNRRQFCAIINAKSGRCGEDCAFCAQSAHYQTPARNHDFIPLDSIVAAARTMQARGACRFSVVLSGKSVDNDDFERLLQATRAVREIPGLLPDTSPGVLDRDRLRRLKAAGLAGYHHNLETSRRFFPRICSTHDWEEDLESVRLALEEGLYVCSGGIFGLGETWDDRIDLALTLRRLGVPSVPVNFLHPIPGTPLGDRQPLSPAEGLKIIALLRFLLPGAHVRVCGGRETVFGSTPDYHVLRCGASGMMVGNYLTIAGQDPEKDLADLSATGLILSRAEDQPWLKNRANLPERD